MLYDWLRQHFRENEPILIEEVAPQDLSEVEVRQEMKRLASMGLVCRYDAGVFYLPPEGLTRQVVRPPRTVFAEKKFMTDGSGPCGYVSGKAFAAELGLVRRPVTVIDIVTNKERKAHRETSLGGQLYQLRRPYVLVNESNRDLLQLLDLIRDLDEVTDLDPAEAEQRIREHVERADITFADIEPFLEYYPERIYKNLYRCGLLSGRMSANRKEAFHEKN